MKRISFLIVPLLVILVYLTQIDDDMSVEATKLIKKVEVAGNSKSYLYLLGIYANENEYPEDVGRGVLEEYRRLEADNSYEIVEYQESKRIPLPEGEIFCGAWEEGCLKILFSSEVDIESLFQEHEVLIYRSNKFFDFIEYTTLAKPAINEQFPPYQYIRAAERIKVLRAISTYKNGNAQEAINSLFTQFSKLRKSLELQDSLVGKLVFLMKLSEIIDVSSIIISKEESNIEIIPRLSLAEKNFNIVLAREFGVAYYTFKELDKNPEFFEMGGDFPGWIIRIVYKPNMTINAITPIYSRLERLAQLTPSNFSREIENRNATSISTSWFRNYIGAALITIMSSPSLDEYLARFMDFDTKILLFNQVHHFKRKLTDVKNPYYENETPEELDGMACFNGPLEDKKFLRCLRLKI